MRSRVRVSSSPPDLNIMLTKKYLNSTKNIPAIMEKIIAGTAPEKFTTEHLKKIGFGASNDRAMVGLLKELGFLNESGNPTKRYHSYRNTAKSKTVLGEALKEAYSDIFHINENPSDSDKESIAGFFKSTHNVSEQVSNFMANTFLALLGLAVIPRGTSEIKKDELPEKSRQKAKNDSTEESYVPSDKKRLTPSLRYNIEIHLPATKDIEVYNSIFKSLREHLIDD